MEDLQKYYSENSVNEGKKKSGVHYKPVTRSELKKFSEVFTRLLFQVLNPEK